MRLKNIKIFITIFFLVIITGCNKDAGPNCVTWIVSDSWENSKGTPLQDYNRIYGLQLGHQIPVCGSAKDTIFEEKKVVLRSLHDTAFYVRVYVVKYRPNDNN